MSLSKSVFQEKCAQFLHPSSQDLPPENSAFLFGTGMTSPSATPLPWAKLDPSHHVLACLPLLLEASVCGRCAHLV